MESSDEVVLPSRLMVITDRVRTEHALPDALQHAVRGGARWIRVREPDLDLFSYIALCHVLIDTVADPRVTWSVRPSAYAIVRTAYPELRLAVHCAERDALFAATDASTIVGRSVHRETPRERSPAAHYLLFAPVFATDSKPGVAPAGVESLRALVDASGAAVVALGGVTSATVAECALAGARAVAACSFVLHATDPAERVRALLSAWPEGTPAR